MTKGILPEEIDQELMGFYALVIERAKDAIRKSTRRHDGRNHKKPHSYSHGKERFRVLYSSNGCQREWVAYNQMKRWVEEGDGLPRERWVKSKKGEGRYNPTKIELGEDTKAQLFERFESALRYEKDPLMEVSKEYSISIHRLSKLFNHYHADDTHYFITEDALNQMATDPKKVTDRDIGFLLLNPHLNVVEKEAVISGDNYVFVDLKEKANNYTSISSSRMKTLPFSSLDLEQKRMIGGVVDLVRETQLHEDSHWITLLNKM